VDRGPVTWNAKAAKIAKTRGNHEDTKKNEDARRRKEDDVNCGAMVA